MPIRWGRRLWWAFARKLANTHPTADFQLSTFNSLHQFAADLVQPVGAQLEPLAEAAQHLGLVGHVRGLVGAGDEVRALALSAVVQEAILAQRGALLLQRFGEQSGPEEREVAD